VLELRSNNISVIPPEIKSLKNLQKLDLSQNKIQILPLDMWELNKLATLDLNGNPLISIPNNVIQGGAATLLPFLKERDMAQRQKQGYATKRGK
jgi:Leucine-rich repeat (LRR) protein